MEYFTRDSCRLCNSKNLISVIKLKDTPPANAFLKKNQLINKQNVYPLELFHCSDCFHLQLTTVVDPKKLFEDYVYVSGTSQVFVNHFEDYCNLIIKKYNPKKGTLIIDIGSNDGTFLSFFKKKEFKVIGIDPAINIAEKASQKGIRTIPSFFNQNLASKILSEHGKASIISANNVFAHSDNLTEIIKGIKAILASDGLFVFEVSYLVDVYEKTLFDTIYHEHLAYHSVKPLKTFFEKNQMELISVERVSTHGGSIRGFVQHKGANRKVENSVKEMIEIENKLGFESQKPFLKFSQKISKINNNLNKIIKEIKKEGKSIIGFGAPAKATTLMYQFDIDNNYIDFIVDDNPLKQGTFTPGLNIPVYSTKKIKEKKPDYILILAWNFADSIIKNHSYFKKQNGRFIIPLPKVTII